MSPKKPPNQKKKFYNRFKYDGDTLKLAVLTVQRNEINKNEASKLYGILKSTLIKKVNSGVMTIEKMGPDTVLTTAEEEKVKNWIIAKAKIGFPMNCDEVKDTVKLILEDLKRENPFTDNRPGDSWMKLFLRRHKSIGKKNTEVLSKARAAVERKNIGLVF